MEPIKITWDSDARVWKPAVLSVPQAGHWLGMSPRTAYDRVAAGDFPIRTIMCGSRIKVPVADLFRHLGVRPFTDAA